MTILKKIIPAPVALAASAILTLSAATGSCGVPRTAVPPAAASTASAGPALEEPQLRVDPGARYLFYLHGRIVQEQGRDAVSPEYGRYEYDAILRGFADAGFEVVSEVRPKDSAPSAYADRVVARLRRLLDGGVPASRIAVVGASMGGYIALLVSSRLSERDIGYAVMGICGDETLDLGGGLNGDLLSIYETSDDLGRSCAPLFARSTALTRHAEVRLDTGLRHGFLYRPLPQWMEPVTRWARDRGDPERKPAPRAPLTAQFRAMATRSDCASIKNELFVIDRTLVFWRRVGNCPDNGYAVILYGSTVDDLLCSFNDTIAGPRKSCRDARYREMFETLVQDSGRPDLGLGPGHTVEALPLDEPGAGAGNAGHEI